MIHRKDFQAYENVRQSGVTNMFNFAVVSELSGLSKAKIIEVMRHYQALKKEWNAVTATKKSMH